MTNTNAGGGVTLTAIVKSDFTAGVPAGEYQVTLTELPFGYVVESITSGSKNLQKETLQVDTANPPKIDVKLRRTQDAR